MTITLVDNVWTKSSISLPQLPKIKVTLRQLISDLVRESLGNPEMLEGTLARRLLGNVENKAGQQWLPADNSLLKLKVESALNAVSSNRIFAFVGGEQVVDLDAPLSLSAGATVEFFAITPVQGG